MTTGNTIRTFSLDADDERHVNQAIAYRQAHLRVEGECILPEGESDTAGAILAEICRDWLEAHGQELARERPSV
jgi:hypothetical protein